MLVGRGSVSRGRNAVLIRQWRLVRAIAAQRGGASVQRLMLATDTPRSTLYRDLDQLRAAGVCIDSRRVNGEARYSLAGLTLPPLAPSATQLAALRFARRAVGFLEGTEITSEIDALLKPYATQGSTSLKVSARRTPFLPPAVVGPLDRAIRQQRRVRIRTYTANNRKLQWRLLDPLMLRHVKDALYLIAFDLQPRAIRTFKVARITQVQKLLDKAEDHDLDASTFFAKSVKIWSGRTWNVQVRLSAEVAHLAGEYPLVESQSVQTDQRGCVVVRASVAGLPEAMRWVLSWGRGAEVIAPRELREAVEQELGAAYARYVHADDRVHTTPHAPVASSQGKAADAK